MSSLPVFFDSTGARSRWFKQALVVLASVFTVSATLFVLSLLLVPFLAPGKESTSTRLRHLLPTVLRRSSPFTLSQQSQLLWNEIKQERSKTALTASSSGTAASGSNEKDAPIVAAFYAPWEDTGIASLRAQANHLTHIMPEWLHLNENGHDLDFEDFDLTLNPKNRDVMTIARQHGVAIQPLFSNAQNENFDPKRAGELLHSPQAQLALSQKLGTWLQANNFQGLNLDFENLKAADYPLYPAFVRVLADELHKRQLSLSVDIETDLSDSVLRDVADSCDFVVLMAYDQHYSTGKPGPIAPWKWGTQLVKHVVNVVPPEKLVLGIGNYAYDWVEDSNAPAESLTYQSAVLCALESADDKKKPEELIDFDPDALNPTFQYEEDGKTHQVWMLDAITAYNQWLITHRMGLRGGALWVLGSEDPAIWKFFKRPSTPPTAFHIDQLKKIQFPYEIDFTGQGEVLKVVASPETGERQLEFDDKSGLCTDEIYQKFPTSYVIQRSGYAKKTLALTFDDGPDAEWTPEVLDLLKKYHVQATFFLVGKNIERNRSLVRRIWDEGHDIGNHSFTHANLGAVSPRRADLEINATQRAIQSVIGCSSRLFRPPYNADAEPSSGEEVRPVIQASQLGYLTIGESIDPQDWNPYKLDKDDHPVPRTALDIEREVMRGASQKEGNVILLHDAGGDREKTVEALGRIIPKLQKQGFHFVTTSQLLGVPRAALMPPLTGKQRMIVAFDRGMFSLMFSVEWLLTLGFLSAIALGVGRIALILPLAFLSRRGERKRIFDPTFQPTVSVVIAAYNEAPVIERTIHSILASDYPDFEIIVVDDGSKDGTGDIVRKAFGNEPRVQLFEQTNGGKASALNRALSVAKGSVFVGFDADTQIAANSIGLLVRHFSDKQVGAVAGNVKVGNQLNILTRWQAIEYVTSQNLDRRAQSFLNTITVVPGAIGAWRREAVQSLGGYMTDTMAEDMDLTWRLHRSGWKIANETNALAYTEAPDTLKALYKQRFRWAYGTLQCLFKHRGALGKHGWFGMAALPALWIFQFVLQWLAPCVDLQLMIAAVSTLSSWWIEGTTHGNWHAAPETLLFLQKTGFFYALFFAVELIGSYAAIRMDREKPSALWWLFWQRFVYRQMLYVVIWKATWTALSGFRQGWGELARKGTVSLPKTPSSASSVRQ